MNEEFKGLYKNYAMAEGVKEKPYDANLRTGLENILKIEKPEFADLRGMPADEANKLATAFGGEFQGKLVDYVGANLEGLASDVVSEETALPLILSLNPYLDSDKAKLVKEIKEGMQLVEEAEKNPRFIEAMAQELISHNDNGFLKDAIMYIATSGNPDWVKNSYAGLIAMKQRILADKFSKESEGKKKLDINAVRKYVVGNLEATPDEEKQETYMQFANIVANVYQKQEAEKQKAEQEKAAKE